MAQLVEESAKILRALIGRKALSPIELFDACVARIEAVNPAVNAIVALDLDRGRDAAKSAEAAVMRGARLGTLHGLPIAVKDLTPTEGLRTTWGSLVYRDHVPEADDAIVARIRAAGGIVVGKTNTPEFGAGANTVNRVYGATVNPFDTELSCAGSSGGSAVALATGMVPLATGSDLGGSLRTPASFCGVVGHRPSVGTVANPSRGFGWSPLACDGPMARTVDDAALLMSAIAGHDERDPLSRPQEGQVVRGLADADPSALRIVFSEDLGCAPVSRGVRDWFRTTAESLAPLFASARWQDPDLGDVHTTFETLRGVQFVASHGEVVDRHVGLLGPNVIANVASGRALSIADVAAATLQHTALYRRFQGFFDDIDLLICPAAAAVPYPVDDLAVLEIDGETLATYVTWLAITYAITLTGHPATVIPCGLGPTGMPIGLQLVGRAGDDRGTLAIARALEATLAADEPRRRPVPDIEALAAGNRPTKAFRIPPVLESA